MTYKKKWGYSLKQKCGQGQTFWIRMVLLRYEDWMSSKPLTQKYYILQIQKHMSANMVTNYHKFSKALRKFK